MNIEQNQIRFQFRCLLKGTQSVRGLATCGSEIGFFICLARKLWFLFKERSGRKSFGAKKIFTNKATQFRSDG